MKNKNTRNNPLFLRNEFNMAGKYDMPVIKKEIFDLTGIKLLGYDHVSSANNETEKWIHFFLEDYKFESLYRNPKGMLEKLKRYKGILSPDYSMFLEMPKPLQIMSVFKSRWVGAYFQSRALKVIPTIRWGDKESFKFCFDGIEPGGIVAVSTLGVRKEVDWFMQGFNEMIKRLSPITIICYGKPFDEMYGNIIEIDYNITNNLVNNKSNASVSNEYKFNHGRLTDEQIKASSEYKDLMENLYPYLLQSDGKEYIINLLKNKSKDSILDYKQYTSHKDKTNYLYYDSIIFKGGGVSSDFFLRVPTTEKSVEVKLLNYLLDESHPSGGSKAKWLRKALNFTKKIGKILLNS